MYAMQYRITLPADYDMRIIRERVRVNGHLMDGFAGLEFKAYLILDRTKGAFRNAYAPFYVWRDTNGMRSFCWGEPGYSSIVRDFGRHPIQDWTVHGLVHGPATHASARSLSIETVSLPVEVAPSECIEAFAVGFLRSSDDDTVARVVAVDVTSWNLIRVELSVKEADQVSMNRTTYEVLHVSTG